MQIKCFTVLRSGRIGNNYKTLRGGGKKKAEVKTYHLNSIEGSDNGRQLGVVNDIGQVRHTKGIIESNLSHYTVR